MILHAKSPRIGSAAAALGAMFVGLALTTSVAGALVGAPDVTVSLSRGRAGPLEPGTSFAWILVGSNDGAAIAHDVVVSSSLPQGVTSVSPPPSCLVGSTLRCPVGDLAPGGHVRIALALHVEDGTCGELRIESDECTALAHRDQLVPVEAEHTSRRKAAYRSAAEPRA